MRQIIVDTETTGLDPKQGHRIIEIGCIELVKRKFTGNNFHVYLNPEREVEAGALKVHGITNAFLANKPTFSDVYQSFQSYLLDAELVIHNAPFDLGFLNHEFRLLNSKYMNIEINRNIIDTLLMARKMHPGQRNSLDALCKRYQIDNSNRKFHGALLDAEILARVYLAMTGGQSTLFDLSSAEDSIETNLSSDVTNSVNTITKPHWELPVILANDDECFAHENYFKELQDK